MSRIDSAVAQRAPVSRVPMPTVQEQANHLKQYALLEPLLNAMPVAVALLNSQRQIVFANQQFRRFRKLTDFVPFRGMRPGEAMNCVHADDGPTGCGTSEYCVSCGALKAIVVAQHGRANAQECHITTENEGERSALDLRVWATPFEFDGQPFTLVAAEDISDEKRRRVLERLFFHDIANTAGAIAGLAEMVETTSDPVEGGRYNFTTQLVRASRKLTDEIEAQRQIVAAERGELQVQTEPLATASFLASLVEMYREHPVAKGRHLGLDPAAEEFIIWSDQALLGRVIGNMVKNALEAASTGETVTLGCKQLFDHALFWVHNPRPMPRSVQLQVFKRSFSTKGANRGLGTYSMKLLTEAYLQGKVSFQSMADAGTIFTAMYPIQLLPVGQQSVNGMKNGRANGYKNGHNSGHRNGYRNGQSHPKIEAATVLPPLRQI